MEGHAADTRFAEARAVRGGGGPGAVRQALAAVDAALRESYAFGSWGGGGPAPSRSPLDGARSSEPDGAPDTRPGLRGRGPVLAAPGATPPSADASSPRSPLQAASAANRGGVPLRNASPRESAGPVAPPVVTRAVEEALTEALEDVGWVVLQVRAEGVTCGGIEVAGPDLAAALAALEIASVLFWGAGAAEAAAFLALAGLARGGGYEGDAGRAAVAAWRAAHLGAHVEALPARVQGASPPPSSATAGGASPESELGAEARERLRVLRARPSGYLGRVRLAPPPVAGSPPSTGVAPDVPPRAPRLADNLARLAPHAPGLAARVGTSQVQAGDLEVLTLLLDAVDADPTLRETCVRAGTARRGLTARLDPRAHAAWCFSWWGLTLPEALSEVGHIAAALGESHAAILHDALAARAVPLPAMAPADVSGLVAYLELAARTHDLAACAEAARSLGHVDARVRMAALRAWAHARPADDARVSALAARDPDPRVRATARGVLTGAP
jgi:hypothetical protein